MEGITIVIEASLFKKEEKTFRKPWTKLCSALKKHFWTAASLSFKFLMKQRVVFADNYYCCPVALVRAPC